MNSILILLIPVLANLLGVYLVIAKMRPAFVTILASNLGGSVLFGLFFAIRVMCCSAETTWWLMPLVFAPLEYWTRFGIAIIMLAGIMAVWSKRKSHRQSS